MRYRVDGLLFDLLEVPRSLHLAVVSRLKIISRLDIAERRLPQDGSFASQHPRARDRLPRLHPARPSTARRSCSGSSRRKRWSSTTRSRTWASSPTSSSTSCAGIRRPWGMVLLTGPTGSGKSTTLHTAIKAIKSPRKNIITVEDPVEYRQPGIQQVQVKTEIGFDFARSLRSILAAGPRHHHDRRDPRPGDGADRGAGGAHRPPRALDPAHQRRGLHRHPAHQHRRGAVPRRHRRQRGGGAAAGAEESARRARRPTGRTPRRRPSSRPIPSPRCSIAGRGCKACRNIGYSGRMALYEVFWVNARGPAHGARRRRRRHHPAATRSTAG